MVGCFLHVLGIFIGQTILGENSVHFHVILSLYAQHVHNLSYRVLLLIVRPFGDFHYRLLTRLAFLQLAPGNNNVGGKHVILRYKVSDILAHTQLAHKGILGPLQHLDDLRLADMVLSSGKVGKTHAVTCQSTFGITFRHEDRLIAAIGNDRVLAIQLAHELPFLHLSGGIQTESVVAYLGKHIIPYHLLHDVNGKHLERMGFQFQVTEYILETTSLLGSRLEIVFQQYRQLTFVEVFSSFFPFGHSVTG